MTTKTYTVDFYTVQVGAGGVNAAFTGFLTDLAENDGISAPRSDNNGNEWIIKSVVGNRRYYSGVYGKLRKNDIPKIGDEAGHEEEIQLEDHQGLIEKNYFLYYPQQNLLVWQVNVSASWPASFASYLTDHFGEATIFHPVVTVDNMERFMRGDAELVKAELTIARPTNPELYDNDDFSRSVMQLMNGTEAASIRLSVVANRPGGRGERLPNQLKDSINMLTDSGVVRRAKADVSYDGETHPIDLIYDRLKAKITVDLIGRYPDHRMVLSELASAKSGVQGQLDGYFGQNGQAID